MKTSDYAVSITVNSTPAKAFECINRVSAWWTENLEGNPEKQNSEFTVRFGETFMTLRVTELIPGKKINWHVTDCNKHWLKDKKEWKGTTLTWEISAHGTSSQIDFKHLGLIPGLECYDVCENAWNGYLFESLADLINSGKGNPDAKVS